MSDMNWKKPAIGAAVLVAVVGIWFVFRGSSQGDLAGRVTCDGKPVTVGTVVVLAADGSLRCALLDGEGRYRVAGVPRGTVKLGVVSRDPNKLRERHSQLAGTSERLPDADRSAPVSQTSGVWFPVPNRFEDPKFSGIETTVKKKAEFDIELK